jgi:Ca2+-binding RTX toxin-like protein
MRYLSRLALILLLVSPAGSAVAAEEIDIRYQAQLVVGGPHSSAGAGSLLANAGDTDGDGREDLLVKSAGEDASPSVRIVYGRSAYDYEDLASPHGSASIEGFETITHIDGIGDVNGDGLADIVVVGTLRGLSIAASIVLGQRERTDRTLAWNEHHGFRVLPSESGEFSVAPLGDVNGDGLDDIAVGEPNANLASVVFGSAESGVVQVEQLGARGYRIRGTSAFGEAVAGPGDFDGDGKRDILVGAPRATFEGYDAGAVYAISLEGRTTDLDLAGGFQGFRIDGKGGDPSDQRISIGRDAHHLGDLDGDGLADIWVTNQYSRSLLIRGSASEETVRAAALGGRGETISYSGFNNALGAVHWNADSRPDLLFSYCLVCFGVVRGQVLAVQLDGDETTPPDQLVDVSFREPFEFDHRGQPIGVPPNAEVAAGDFNGDGQTDMALASGAVDIDDRVDAGAVFVLWDRDRRVAPGTCVEVRAGSPFANALTGTHTGDALAGHGGNDTLLGLTGNDCLAGGEGDDSLHGSAGDDGLDAGPGADTMTAGSGDDLLAPGPGADRIQAGAGGDLLDARDGERDTIDCGEGVDFAYADRADSIRECEPYGPNVQVSARDLAGDVQNPSNSTALAYDRRRDRYLLAWGRNDHIQTRLVDGRGFPLGAPRSVAGPTALAAPSPWIPDQPRLAAAPLPGGRGFVVAWSEAVVSSPTPQYRIVIQALDPAGAPNGDTRYLTEQPSQGLGQVTPSVAAGPRGRLLAVWEAAGAGLSRNVRGRMLDRAGSPTGRVLGLANSRAGDDVRAHPSLTRRRRGWLLTFVGKARQLPLARAIAANGRPQGPVRNLARGQSDGRVDEVHASYDPATRRHFVVWHSLHAVYGSNLHGRFTSAIGRPLGRKPRTLAGEGVPRSDSYAFTPALANGRGRFLLVWSESYRGAQAAWINRRGRLRGRRKLADPRSYTEALGYSPRERRFLIASVVPVLEGPNTYDDRLFARTWPGAPPR